MARLLLVEDHTLFRAGIRALVEKSAAGHRIVGEAGDGLEALRLAGEQQPEVVLMDVTMPRLNGIETCRQMIKASPSSRVVVLSMHADPAFVQASLDAGAWGYVLKDAAFGELEAAIRSVMSGQKYLSASIRVAPEGGRPQSGPASPMLAKLAPRERQILQLVGEANSNAEIAQTLGLSVRTVETYRQNMMDKLDLHSVAALTAFAIRHGVCAVDLKTPASAPAEAV